MNNNVNEVPHHTAVLVLSSPTDLVAVKPLQAPNITHPYLTDGVQRIDVLVLTSSTSGRLSITAHPQLHNNATLGRGALGGRAVLRSGLVDSPPDRWIPRTAPSYIYPLSPCTFSQHEARTHRCYLQVQQESTHVALYYPRKYSKGGKIMPQWTTQLDFECFTCVHQSPSASNVQIRIHFPKSAP